MDPITTAELIDILTSTFVYKQVTSDGKTLITKNIKEKIAKKKEENDFRSIISGILDKEEEQYENADLDEEFDFQGLCDYFGTAFQDSMLIFLTADGDTRTDILHDIELKARKSAKCENKRKATARVAKITSKLMEAIYSYSRGKAPSEILIILGELEQSLNQLEHKFESQLTILPSLFQDIFFEQQRDREKRLNHYLEERFQRIKELHPSFKLMKPGVYDKRLSPQIKSISTSDRIQYNEMPESIWHLIMETWKWQENHSIVIAGEGGIGKSVTLLSMTNYLENKRIIPTLFIPVIDLVKDGTCLTISEYLDHRLHDKCNEILEIASRSWNGPSLLILLDGFNEIPLRNRHDMMSKIEDWHVDYPGAQFIVASRPTNGSLSVDEFPGKPIRIELTTIREEIVQKYVSDHFPERVLPPAKSKIWELLVYPLFLALYLRADRLDENAACGYPLEPRETKGQGTILWNFFQRELLRVRSEKWVVRYAVISQYLLPRVAWEMVQREQISLPKEEIIGLIEQTMEQLDVSRLPSHLRQIYDLYEERNGDFPNLNVLLSKDSISSIVFNQCGLLAVPSLAKPSARTHYEFIHQFFKDCLAGLYLVNLAEMNEEREVPESWHHIQHHIMDYVAELISEETAMRLWEVNRQAQQYSLGCKTDHVATCFLLELWKRLGISKSGLSFSGMDLHGLSLVRYLKDSNLDLFRKPSHSRGTILDIDTFLREGHYGKINCIATLQDGYIISNAVDESLLIWEPTTGQCIKPIFRAGKMTCLAGRYKGFIIGCDNQGFIRIWDSPSGKLINMCQAHSSSINCVAMTPNGLIVTGSDDCTLRLWDPRGERSGKIIGKHQGPVRCVGVLPNGTIISGSDDHTLRLWDPIHEEYQKLLGKHKGAVNCLAVLPKGNIVSASDDKTIRVWDLNCDEPLQTLSSGGGYVTSLAPLPDGRVVSSKSNNSVQLWSITEDVLPRTLQNIKSSYIASLQDGRVIGCLSDAVMIWDSITWDCQHTLGFQFNPICCLATLPNGLIVSGSENGKLRVWEPETGRLLPTKFDNTKKVNSLATFPDGHFIGGTEDGKLCVWDSATGALVRDAQAANVPITCVAAFPTGRVAVGFWMKTLAVWKKANDQLTKVMEKSVLMVNCMAALSNKLLICGTSVGQIQVWDCQNHICVFSKTTRNCPVSCVVGLNDGRVVIGYRDGKLEAWDFSKKECLPFSQRHAKAVTCIAILNDGRVVSGSKDHTIRIWDADTGICKRTYDCVTGEVECITVLQNNNVVCGLNNGGMQVWDPKEEECINVFEAIEYDVSKMNFKLASISAQTRKILWQNGAKAYSDE